MSWMGVITNAGQELLNTWASGGHTLTIEGATVGDEYRAVSEMVEATALVNEVATASLIGTKEVDNATQFKISITAAQTSYIAHEIGIWAHVDNGERTLLAYHQDRMTGVNIPSISESPDFAFVLYAVHAFRNDGTMTVNIDQSAYVANEIFQDAIADINADIDAIELHMSSSVDPHITNTNNPHQVTKDQVGLGNVPNVATNDQTPTFTEASTLANIESGSTLADIYGKVKKAISSLISHLANTTVHITATERTTWNGKANGTHTHSASDITSGAVPVARGGTGATTASAALTNLGAAASSHNHSAANITSGTLAMARGGTGATSAAGIRTAIGLDAMVKFVAATKTGATYVSQGHGKVDVALDVPSGYSIIAVSQCTFLNGSIDVIGVTFSGSTASVYYRNPYTTVSGQVLFITVVCIKTIFK